MKIDISAVNPKENIIIKGAKLHNLKNIDVVIPRNKLVVITGLSGSGKSSLAFDTLYAEGQRRYVESLSSYARQFLGKLHKPKVDYIKGIAPAIAIEQKVNSTNPRSTVGTSTEIYDYIKLLFARVGKTYSPISGGEVKKDTVSDVVKFIKKFFFDCVSSHRIYKLLFPKCIGGIAEGILISAKILAVISKVLISNKQSAIESRRISFNMILRI